MWEWYSAPFISRHVHIMEDNVNAQWRRTILACNVHGHDTDSDPSDTIKHGHIFNLEYSLLELLVMYYSLSRKSKNLQLFL